ncbi:MAG: hypothetical protein K2M10_07980 [Muribaculaceae bacterium]|nr:hypothetical protein [Muribaculaceae bacterium]
MCKFIISFSSILFALSVFANPTAAPKDYVYTKKNSLQVQKADSVGMSNAPADSLATPASTPAIKKEKAPFSFAKVKEWCAANDVADNLTVSFTIGSGGLGLEVATPLTHWARLRTGVEWVPSFKIPLNFNLSSFSENGATNDVSHIQQLVKDMMGLDMDDNVTMDAKPNMLNYKLLVDIFPFRNNRHWHFTAGFYVGSPVIGRAKNSRSEMQTLVGVNIYNRAYNYFTSPDFDPFTVAIGNGNYLDPELAMEYHDKFERYGRVGIHIGDFKNGTPYLMEPTSEGRVSAKATTNNFRPYLGFGYGATVDKKQRLELGFDAGVLFWGGTPDVILHDGVNLTKDIVNIRGKVGTYVDIMKALPVYPLINFKISYTIF